MSLPLLWAATAFSIGISIGGMDIPHFNNVQISYSADGTGTKGVISQQLSFNVPSAEYGSTQGLFPYGSEVIVSCGLSLPKFYVYSRKPNGVNVSLVCYDRAMFTANKLTLSEDNFGEDGYIPVSSVMDNIKAVCGFSYIGTGDIIGSVITRMHKDNVLNKPAKTVLSELAEASAGCFFVQENNSLAFFPFASGSISAEFPVEKYEKVCYGLSVSCGSVILRNGDKVYSSGGDSGAFGTMSIDTVYASVDLLSGLAAAYMGKTYTAWKCGNALVEHYPAPGAGIKFGDSSDALVCNFCKMKITSSGFFASMGRNDVSESEYISEYSRALSDRVKIGETNGNTKVSRDGIKLVYINENDGKSEEHGFKTFAGGLAEFGGALLDSVMPDEIVTVSETDTAVEQRIVYGGKTYTLKYTKDGTKKSNITFTEVVV